LEADRQSSCSLIILLEELVETPREIGVEGIAFRVFEACVEILASEGGEPSVSVICEG
jgi:hypothetical protein